MNMGDSGGSYLASQNGTTSNFQANPAPFNTTTRLGLFPRGPKPSIVLGADCASDGAPESYGCSSTRSRLDSKEHNLPVWSYLLTPNADQRMERERPEKQGRKQVYGEQRRGGFKEPHGQGVGQHCC